MLEGEPERFGDLKTVDRRRSLGLGVAHSTSQARAAAPRAAFLARELAEAKQALSALVEQQVDRTNAPPDATGKKAGEWLETARAEATAAGNRAAERLRRLQLELQHAPSLGLLERSIGRAVDRLMPREIAQLRRALTAPKAFIAFKAREAIKDIILGREEDDEDD